MKRFIIIVLMFAGVIVNAECQVCGEYLCRSKKCEQIIKEWNKRYEENRKRAEEIEEAKAKEILKRWEEEKRNNAEKEKNTLNEEIRRYFDNVKRIHGEEYVNNLKKEMLIFDKRAICDSDNDTEYVCIYLKAYDKHLKMIESDDIVRTLGKRSFDISSYERLLTVQIERINAILENDDEFLKNDIYHVIMYGAYKITKKSERDFNKVMYEREEALRKKRKEDYKRRVEAEKKMKH